jgi:hypothetical protein
VELLSNRNSHVWQKATWHQHVYLRPRTANPVRHSGGCIADPLSSNFQFEGEAAMREMYSDSIAEHLVERFPWRGHRRSTEGIIRQELAEAAEREFSESNLPIETIEDAYGFALDVLDAIKAGARREQDESRDELWSHRDRLIHGDPLSPEFFFIADELRFGSRDYLSQSLKSPELDLVLLDALAACEAHEYWRYINAEKGLPKDLRPIGPVGLFARTSAWVIGLLGMVWGGFYFGLPKWLPIVTPVLVTVGVLLELIVLWGSVGLASTERAKRKTNSHLIKQMLDAYHSIPRDYPVSFRELRRIFQKTGDAGVSWPSAIFALLDDIESRS